MYVHLIVRDRLTLNNQTLECLTFFFFFVSTGNGRFQTRRISDQQFSVIFRVTLYSPRPLSKTHNTRDIDVRVIH